MRQATSLGWLRSFAGSKPAARALAAAASAARDTGENAAGDRRPSASRKLCLHESQSAFQSSAKVYACQATNGICQMLCLLQRFSWRHFA